MESTLRKITKDVKTKWVKISKNDKKFAIEEKIQKIINIPLEDIKNIIEEKV